MSVGSRRRTVLAPGGRAPLRSLAERSAALERMVHPPVPTSASSRSYVIPLHFHPISISIQPYPYLYLDSATWSSSHPPHPSYGIVRPNRVILHHGRDRNSSSSSNGCRHCRHGVLGEKGSLDWSHGRRNGPWMAADQPWSLA